MAVGKQNRFSAGKAFTVTLKVKNGEEFLDTPEWLFEAKSPAGDYEPLTPEQIKEAFDVDGPIRDVAGDLLSVNTRLGSFNDDPIHNVTLSLLDSQRDEIYYVQFVANNNLGRSIANSLLNLPGFANVQLGLWAQENKELKRRFGACSIRQGTDTTTVKRKYDAKTDPNMQPREYEGPGGKKKKDWTKVDAFLFAELAKLGDSIKSNRPKQETAPVQESPKEAPQTVTPTTAAAPAAQEDGDADAPF